MVSATSTPPSRTHGQRVAGHEVAVLVEDAVVGQVVLEVAWRPPGRRAAAPSALRGPRPARRVGAEPAPGRRRRGSRRPRRASPRPSAARSAASRSQRGPGGRDERLAEHQVLDRVAGEHHLRERDEVGAGLGGRAGSSRAPRPRCRRGRRRSSSPGRGRCAAWAWRSLFPSDRRAVRAACRTSDQLDVTRARARVVSVISA